MARNFKISGETEFPMPTRNFDISASASGYTFQISEDYTRVADPADATWYDKAVVEEDEPAFVRNAVPKVMCRLHGNTSDVYVTYDILGGNDL